MNDIEHKFFRTFEIRPRAYFGSAEGKRIESLELYPPEITDKILLDIANVLVDWTGSLLITDTNIRNEILEDAIFVANKKDVNEFIKQVQALFKEE